MNANEMKYLVFSIGGDFYCSPLLSIREVLEFQQPKIMPNMVNYFSGVINVRGAIVGVLDMRTKFGLTSKNSSKTPLLLCDTDKGAIAAIVDSVDRVQEFTEEEIERKPPVQSRVKQDYLLGVAKSKEQLITIVDLHKLLTEVELKVS